MVPGLLLALGATSTRGLYRFSPDSGYVKIGNRGVSFIAGNGDNNVIAVDAVGGVYHWNVPKIRKIPTLFGDSISPRVRGIAMRENQIIIVGGISGELRGFILTRIRNELQ